MATDNTIIGATSDVIRDLARQGGAVKTQVMQLDFGGASANAESLVAVGNPLPVSPPALASVATSVAASSLVLKGSAGNLFSLMATATVSGWLLLFDATSAPADGTVTPKWAYPILAGGALNMAWLNPLVFATGVTVVFSTTGPFTKTASATAFISGQVQ